MFTSTTLVAFAMLPFTAQAGWEARWKAKLDAPPSATAAIWKDLVVVPTASETGGGVAALDLATGKVRWQFPAGSPVRCAPVVDAEGKVIFGTDSGKVYALDAASGQKRWDFDANQEVRGSPTIGLDGTVYVGSVDNHLYAIDSHRGHQRWRVRTGPISTAPLVAVNGMVCVVSDDGNVRAFDPETGQPKWVYNAVDLSETGLAGDQAGVLVLGIGKSRGLSLSPEGTKLAEFTLPAMPTGPLVLSVAGDSLWAVGLLEGNRHQLVRLKRAGDSFAPDWHADADGSPVGFPSLGTSEEVYFASKNGTVRVVDRQGKLIREYHSASPVTAPPSIGVDVIVFGCADGTVHALPALSQSPGSAAQWPMLGQNAQHTGQARGAFVLPGEEIPSVRPPAASLIPPDLSPPDLARFQDERIFAVKDGILTIRWKDKENRVLPQKEQVLIVPVPVQNLEVGDQISIPINADLAKRESPDVTPLDGGSPSGTGKGAFFWHRKSKRLYAARPGRWLLKWKTGATTDIPVAVSVSWPRDTSRYQVHVAGTLPVPLHAGGAALAQVWANETAPAADPLTVTEGKFAATAGRRFLILGDNKDDIESAERIWFLWVHSVDTKDPACFRGAKPANIGDEIEPPADLHDPKCGGPWVFYPLARYCADDGYYDRDNRTGPIIPVNTALPDRDDDDLLVVYYQPCRGVRAAGMGEELRPFPGWAHAERFYGRAVRKAAAPAVPAGSWPTSTVLYDCQWPNVTSAAARAYDGPSRIVIAQMKDRPTLDPTVYGSPRVYTQNDPAKPGFNPNDEHAFLEGNDLYALRDDLETPSTSKPWVLVTYQDVRRSARRRVKVYEVRAETEEHRFRYTGVAGTLVQPPLPLSLLQGRTEKFVEGPGHWDRKGQVWARAAGDGGGKAKIVTRYYYPHREEFYYPPEHFPPDRLPAKTKGVVPWLERRAWLNRLRASPGQAVERDYEPIDIVYDISWPDKFPTLYVGDTLTVGKNGLPNMLAPLSVKIVYQQSEALNGKASVSLIDATRAIGVRLEKLPESLTLPPRGILDTDRYYFPQLPPHLRRRVYYDKTRKELCFRGLLLNKEGKEDFARADGFVLLNILNKADADRYVRPLSNDTEFRRAVDALVVRAASVVPAPADEGVVGRALTAGLTGETGYVTLAIDDSKVLNQPDSPVQLRVIRVVKPPREPGRVLVITSEDPFSETVVLRHSGDFVGHPERFQFEWRITSATESGSPDAPPDQWSPFMTNPENGTGADSVTIEGAGLRTLQDNYVACHYRPADGSEPWTAWTKPAFVEGWVKRALRGINPFDQRVKDFRRNPADTRIGMIEQAGPRYRGAVPLTADAAAGFGLIEVYETVYGRARSLSIEGTPPVDHDGANRALQQSAGSLADLYMLLGNEAYADAADPTVAFPASTGRAGLQLLLESHCFANQTPSLLEEELALLRGLDGRQRGSTDVHEAPAFNRLRWNATRDRGEVLYVLNYGIRDVRSTTLAEQDQTRVLDDARRKYPQGHGDAWGHYLTAAKVYYALLRNGHFTWKPEAEHIDLGGEAVQVDYFDERKFARAAAARARTGVEVVALTHRLNFVPEGDDQPVALEDQERERAWGVGDWAVRAGQGAYFDWVVGNALLPPENTKTGLQKIDRSTVPELGELASNFVEIQAETDKACAGLNPLGLAHGVVPMDINLDLLRQGRSHFQQTLDRATRAAVNAAEVLGYALEAKAELYSLGDTSRRFETEVERAERDYKGRMIEIFGTPYTSDIGPGQMYPEGYDGPDLFAFEKSHASNLIAPQTSATVPWKILVKDYSLLPGVDPAKAPKDHVITIDVTSDAFQSMIEKDPNATRRAPGELQLARGDLLQAVAVLDRTVIDYKALVDGIEDAQRLLTLRRDTHAKVLEIKRSDLKELQSLNDAIAIARTVQHACAGTARIARSVARATAESAPKTVGVICGMANGVITDPLAPARGAAFSTGDAVAEIATVAGNAADVLELDRRQAKEVLASKSAIEIANLEGELGDTDAAVKLKAILRQEPAMRLQLYAQREVVQQVAMRYAATLARGLRVWDDWRRVRQTTAAQVRDYRYRDMAFRLFRDEAIQKYRAQSDLAATYTFLAARVLDYETNFGTHDDRQSQIRAVARNVVCARELGRFDAQNRPAFQGGGLAGAIRDMEAMYEGWSSNRSALDEQIDVSLRSHLFRTDDDAAFRDALRRHYVADLASSTELRRFCRDLPSGPGLVIPFATPLDVSNSSNYFGWPAGGGDYNFNPSVYATKLRTVTVRFMNYGDDREEGLRGTPLIYLIPMGCDVFRTPARRGHAGDLRFWEVTDQGVPEQTSFTLGLARQAIGQSGWSPYQGRFGEELFVPRQYHAIVATHDARRLADDRGADSQLVGRSVYNTRWLLVIPGRALLAVDPEEGLNRFVDGVERSGKRQGGITDIVLVVTAYSRRQ